MSTEKLCLFWNGPPDGLRSARSAGVCTGDCSGGGLQVGQCWGHRGIKSLLSQLC